jgi:hypothetical protein
MTKFADALQDIKLTTARSMDASLKITDCRSRSSRINLVKVRFEYSLADQDGQNGVF